ncbi:hypothetical protein FQN05_07370 [Corynebacterium aurimucosum]|uniref:Head-to-tail stopper n=1 Tax=Corynebacterium aurimucosum TaxID=169292 RepID=A0A558IPZ8_9CORY|nr:hypothetical protein FQN05_07370 [Corynebacterium aurimucosum]
MTGRNKLGNAITEETTSQVRVAGWAQPSSDEPKQAGHERLTVDLEIYAPPETFSDGDAVDIPGYGTLEVIGHPENYSHSPFGWDPGLVVVNTRRKDR